MEPTVKPGYLTTEFWLTLGINLVAFLVLFGVIAKGDQVTATETIADAIKAVFAMISSLGSVWKFIQARLEVKKATMEAKSMIQAENIRAESVAENTRLNLSRAAMPVILMLLALSCVPSSVFSQEQPLTIQFPTKKETVKTVEPPVAVVPPSVSVEPSPNKDKAGVQAVGRNRLSLRERRRLGLELPKLREIAQKLKDAGEVDENTTGAEAALLLYGEINRETPERFSGPGFDLEFIQMLLEWFEMLWPFILPFLT